MFGKRCEDCGEVRWSILGRGENETKCPNCGAVMVPERRRPSSRRPESSGTAERRDEHVPRQPVSG